MRYSTCFSATALDGHSYTTPTIGAAYASLFAYEGANHSGQISPEPMKDGKDDVLYLTFDHLEDLVADLSRTLRSSFRLNTYRFAYASDGGTLVFDRDSTQISLLDLQEYLIANYAVIKFPAFFQLNLRTHRWKYYGSMADEKKFEIF